MSATSGFPDHQSDAAENATGSCPQPLKPQKHRWGEKITFPHKSERECLNGCRIVKVVRHESEGGRERHWTEFWRMVAAEQAMDYSERIEGEGTPVCEQVKP